MRLVDPPELEHPSPNVMNLIDLRRCLAGSVIPGIAKRGRSRFLC